MGSAKWRQERYFVNDAMSVEVQWRKVYARYKALTASLADEHFHVIGERVNPTAEE